MSGALFTVLGIILIALIIIFFLAHLPVLANNIVVKWLSKFIISIYVLLLIISVALFYTIPKNGFAEIVNENYRDMKIFQHDWRDIFDPATNKFIVSEYHNKNGEWSFKTNAKTIKIDFPSNISVIAHKKATDDGKVEVWDYVSKYFVSGVDFTNDVKPPLVNFNSDTLSIKNVEKYKVERTLFNKDFTIGQFSSEKSIRVGNGFSGTSGQNIIFIMIPKSTEIEGTSPNIRVE